MPTYHTGWLGLSEEEQAYDKVLRTQAPDNPVFNTGPPLYQQSATFIPADADLKSHLEAQGFEDGWEFWTACDAYFPNGVSPGNQDVGDCVGYSDVLSAKDGMCDEVYWTDQPYAPFLPLVWFSYGAARVYAGNGQLGRRHGSTGAWQIAVDHSHGYLPHDTPGLTVKATERCEPPASEYEAWSWSRSILDRWAPMARPYRIGASTRLGSTAELEQKVLQEHRTFTIASNQGFRKKGFDSRYGITLWEPAGSWAHQMHGRAIVKIKGSWFVYIGNQWGYGFHGDPGKGPRGGFWIPLELMDRWIPRAVVYSRGKFAGRLPKRPDFSLI